MYADWLTYWLTCDFERSLKSSDLARPAGFEPATRCLEGSCSVRLSYGRSNVIVYGEDHATATRRSQCVGREAVPPRETLAASSPRTFQPQRVPQGTVKADLVKPSKLPDRIPVVLAGQLRIETRAAITSESRLLTTSSSGWPQRITRLLEQRCSRCPLS